MSTQPLLWVPGAVTTNLRAIAMNTRKVYIETYGCHMNLADTELLIGILKPHGYEPTKTVDHADVILLNTCAIRERAEERVLKRLQELTYQKARHPGVRLGLTGCMAQHHRDLLLDKAPYLDLILGPDAYRTLPALLAQNNLAAITPRPLAQSLVRMHPLSIHELPYKTSPAAVDVLWHQRNEKDPSQAWLRDMLRRAAEPLLHGTRSLDRTPRKARCECL